MRTLDDPEDPIRIEIAVCIVGEAADMDAAYDLAHSCQKDLNQFLANNYGELLTIDLSQVTYGTQEEDGESTG